MDAKNLPETANRTHRRSDLGTNISTALLKRKLPVHWKFPASSEKCVEQCSQYQRAAMEVQTWLEADFCDEIPTPSKKYRKLSIYDKTIKIKMQS